MAETVMGGNVDTLVDCGADVVAENYSALPLGPDILSSLGPIYCYA